MLIVRNRAELKRFLQQRLAATEGRYAAALRVKLPSERERQSEEAFCRGVIDGLRDGIMAIGCWEEGDELRAFEASVSPADLTR